MTSVSDLSELIHEITPEAFIRKAEEFLHISALEDGETNPDDIVSLACLHNRLDIVEMMKEHDQFGKKAVEELNGRRMPGKSAYDSWHPSDMAPSLLEKYEIVATGDFGRDTFRDRFHVKCRICNKVLHENTTAPDFYINMHQKDGCKNE